ncbi:hypothetical protein AB0G74_32485 [Streptomyces sp. NPDC020875]|uniref:hypothetical protein n=1 Tax=Streptomyces sp. NPDC020875 TaxID=3154898 RepID=UPI0033E5E2F0
MAAAVTGRTVVVRHTPRRVHLERALYTGAALGLTILPNTDPGPAAVAAHTAIFAAAGIGTVRAWRKAAEPDTGLLRTTMRVLPFLSAAAVDAAALGLPGWGWDAVIAGGWWASMTLLVPLSRSGRPLRRAAVLLETIETPGTDDDGEDAKDDGEDEFTRTIRAMWERAALPGDTRLYKVVRHDPDGIDFTALVKAPEGKAVPEFPTRDIAAVFDVHEDTVALAGSRGGPGWAEITVTPDAAEAARSAPQTEADWWAQTIGRESGAAPGSELTGKADRPGVVHYFAKMTDPAEPVRINAHKLCTAFGIGTDDLRVFVTDRGNEFLVSVFDTPPLAATTAATRDLIRPDERGFFRIGTAYDGRPVNGRLYLPGGAAHALLLGASGSGKTQLVVLYMAADSLDGATVWAAAATEDAKLRLAGAHVDRLGFGTLYMVRLLRAAVALLDIRGRMGEAAGHDWIPGARDNPYRRISLYLDEFNAATRCPEYGAEITELAERISIQGRKYGIGIKVSGQDGKVEDGQTTTMRNQLRQNGRQVTLNVGDMDAVRRAFNGLISSDDLPEPLPQEYGGTTLTLQEIADGVEDPEDSQGIGGIGWVVRAGKPVLMRTLYIDLGGDDRDQILTGLFPAAPGRLTAEETTSLGELLGDWNAPAPEPDEGDGEPDRGGETRKGRKGRTVRRHTAVRPPKAHDRVRVFLDMMPGADLDLAVATLTGLGLTPEEITAAYRDITRT